MRASFLVVVCFFFTPSSLWALATNEIVAFGLKHRAITNAELSLESTGGPLTVSNTGGICEDTNCVEAGSFSVSVELGAADTGLFVWPNGEPADGAWLEASSYGTVDGFTSSPVGSAKGTRLAFGEYDVTVDFSPIGATSYTYQVYFHDLLTLEITNQSPDSYVRTSNHDPGPPRVNPVRLQDGHVAVVVEFGRTAEISVPGYSTRATRVVIIAEASATVERVSRLEVTGSSSLSYFRFDNARLGQFGLYHQAIGGVSFGASPSQLVLSNVLNGFEGANIDGMFTELPRVHSYDAELVPHATTNDPSGWMFSMSGINATSPFEEYLGQVRLTRTNGILQLAAELELGAEVVRIYNNSVFVGTFTNGNGVLGVVLETNVVVQSYGAQATQTNEAAHIGIRLASAVTLSNASQVFVGDEWRIACVETSPPVATLASFSVFGENLGDVIITNMQTVVLPPEPLRLNVARNGNQLRLSWPYAPWHSLYRKPDVNDSIWNYITFGLFTNSQSYHVLSATNDASFFSLRHHYADFMVTPGSP